MTKLFYDVLEHSRSLPRLPVQAAPVRTGERLVISATHSRTYYYLILPESTSLL